MKKTIENVLLTFTIPLLVASCSTSKISSGDSQSNVEYDSFSGGKYGNVEQLVRRTPYSKISPGVYENWITSRSWVLKQESFCEEEGRHIFIDLNGKFLSWMQDDDSYFGYFRRQENQKKINGVRVNLDEKHGVGYVEALEYDDTGYPFAYSCKKPQFVQEGIESYFGLKDKDKISGTWRGINIKEKKSLRDVFRLVNSQRDYNLSSGVYSRVLGQFIVESAGDKKARSKQGAVGIMQLMPDVREDCFIPDSHKEHRIAQIDCSLSLLRKNYDFLSKHVGASLYNIPWEKRKKILEWMTTQSYHLGVGNISKIFGNNDGNDLAAKEINNNYSELYEDYSGEDLAMFLILHNYGRNKIGSQAIKYGIDSQIGLEILEDYKQKNKIK